MNKTYHKHTVLRFLLLMAFGALTVAASILQLPQAHSSPGVSMDELICNQFDAGESPIVVMFDIMQRYDLRGSEVGPAMGNAVNRKCPQYREALIAWAERAGEA